MHRPLHRPILAAVLAAALALVAVVPAAAAPRAELVPFANFFDRLAGWLGSLGLAVERPASEGETSPHMDPDGLTTTTPEEGQAQEDSGGSQDTSPFMDPNG